MGGMKKNKKSKAAKSSGLVKLQLLQNFFVRGAFRKKGEVVEFQPVEAAERLRNTSEVFKSVV